MNINYVTTNLGKVKSLQRHLTPYGIEVVHRPIDLSEPRSSEVREIAAHKAREAYRLLNAPLVVLDAGFYIPSLNGFPKAFVNFALETIGVEGILKLAEGKDRTCEFRDCIAYIGPESQEPVLFDSHIGGLLATEIRGAMQNHLWSKLGLVFIPNGKDKTLAEMSLEEYGVFAKRPVSACAQKQFGEWYSTR